MPILGKKLTQQIYELFFLVTYFLEQTSQYLCSPSCWSQYIIEDIAHETRQFCFYRFQQKRAQMTMDDVGIIQANTWGREVACYQPSRILEGVPVMGPAGTKRGNEADPESASSTTDALDIICGCRWCVTECHRQ